MAKEAQEIFGMVLTGWRELVDMTEGCLSGRRRLWLVLLLWAKTIPMRETKGEGESLESTTLLLDMVGWPR
jgi:hypothetical protein